jgi:hypothetical protein
MILLESTNYALISRNGQDCVRVQMDRFGGFLALIEGKGFPLAEELKSRYSSSKSAWRSNINEMPVSVSVLCEYLIENKANTSVPAYVAQSSTLVRRVQLGKCNQFTTLCSGWQGSTQDTRCKGFRSSGSRM